MSKSDEVEVCNNAGILVFLRVKNEYVEKKTFKKVLKTVASTLDPNVEDSLISKSNDTTLLFINV